MQQRYGNSRTAPFMASRGCSWERAILAQTAWEKGQRKWQGNPAMRNHTNCVDLRNLRHSEWDQELGKIDTAYGSTDLICDEGRQTAAVWGLLSSQYSRCGGPTASPTDLRAARQDLRNAHHLIQIKEGNEYKTELQYQSHEISRRQSNDV